MNNVNISNYVKTSQLKVKTTVSPKMQLKSQKSQFYAFASIYITDIVLH